jgi:hypothetical protein
MGAPIVFVGLTTIKVKTLICFTTYILCLLVVEVKYKKPIE